MSIILENRREQKADLGEGKTGKIPLGAACPDTRSILWDSSRERNLNLSLSISLRTWFRRKMGFQQHSTCPHTDEEEAQTIYLSALFCRAV